MLREKKGKRKGSSPTKHPSGEAAPPPEVAASAMDVQETVAALLETMEAEAPEPAKGELAPPPDVAMEVTVAAVEVAVAAVEVAAPEAREVDAPEAKPAPKKLEVIIPEPEPGRT